MEIGKEEYTNEKDNKIKLEIAKETLEHHKKMVKFYEEEIAYCRSSRKSGGKK